MDVRDYYDVAKGISWQAMYEFEKRENDAIKKDYEELQKKCEELRKMKSPFEYALESSLTPALKPIEEALKSLATTAARSYTYRR